jgi:hypothetical protein
MTVTWIVGPRVPVGNTDAKGKFTPRLGKNQGPVFTQQVTKVVAP